MPNLAVGYCVTSLYTDKRSLWNGDAYRCLDTQLCCDGSQILLGRATFPAPRDRVRQNSDCNIPRNHPRTAQREYQAGVSVDNRSRPIIELHYHPWVHLLAVLTDAKALEQ